MTGCSLIGDDMPTNLFHELDIDKKSKIISVGISEFAQYGYINSSTNRIVKNSGISKGSLFQYFQSKEDLYFYILDCISLELTSALGRKTDKFSKDLFKRVVEYSEFEFSWYIQNPEKYKIIIRAFAKSDTEIYQKVEARYNLAGESIYYKLLEDIDSREFKWDKQMTSDILKWFLVGFNEDFIRKMNMHEKTDIEYLKGQYIKRLKEYMEILKKGMLR